MSQSTRVRLSTPPGILSQYRRALFSRASKKKIPKLPATRITLSDTCINAQQVEQYAIVCAFQTPNDTLPLSFPHLLAFPLHLELMLLRDFPFAVMGIIHVRNEILQYRAIKIFEKMDVTCFFSGIRKSDKGYVFDIKTEIHITGERVWESISTNLARKKNTIIANQKTNKVSTLIKHSHKEFWQLPTDLGRRYALISGDANPIHLFSLGAKFFGFKSHIAHGMWSKARTIAALHHNLNSDTCKVIVEFKLPIFLPSTIQLNYTVQQGIIEFNLRDQTGTKPHLKGSFEAL